MQLSRKSLNAYWAWTSALALAMLIVLQLLEGELKARSGYATADLQFVSTGYGLRLIIDHWLSPPNAALSGFILGLDYLFMPLYGAALFFGSLAALDRFAPARGTLRVLLTRLTLFPIGAALCDAIENGFAISMLNQSPSNLLASFALEATAAKWLGIGVGVLLTVAALIGRVVKRRSA
jgi:hypothetical protein